MRRMRIAPVAVLVVAIVLAASFALEAAGLPPVAPGNLAAAKAAAWLREYRYATSELELAGRTARGSCFHGWFGGKLHDDRGTILELGTGTVAVTARHRVIASVLPASLRPLDALLLAGCTKVLGSRLDTLAIDTTVRVHRMELWRRRVAALAFPGLTLIVAPTTDEPVGVELAGLRSRIRLVRLTPALERRLEAQR